MLACSSSAGPTPVATADALRPTHLSKTRMSWSRMMGFETRSTMPTARQASWSVLMSAADRAMIGGAALPNCVRMRWVASRPSMPGSCRSIRIRSKFAPNARSTACSPSTAVVTCMPSPSKKDRATMTLTGLSSTSSTFRSRSAAPSSGIAGSCDDSVPNCDSDSDRLTVKLNDEPTPGALSTRMTPPINPTSCRQMNSPSPVPPKRRVMELSA